MLSIRPKVAELVFQLYSRSLHPELFEIYKSRTIQRGGYTLRLDITSVGHIITWRYEGMTLTEVCASAHQPLPQRRRVIAYQLKGRRVDKLDCHGGVGYKAEFELEPVSTKLFRMCQRELSYDPKQGLVHQFESSGRMNFGALSYINAETRSRSAFIQAFHTFPDDNVIVKTESYFQLP